MGDDIGNRPPSEKPTREDLQRRIEELEQSVRDLSASKERLKFAFEATEDGLWEFVPTTGSLYLNPAWYTMLGYAPYAMRPSFEMWADLVHPEDMQRVSDPLREFLAGRLATLNTEFRMRAQDGDWRWVHSRGGRIDSEDGTSFRLIGTHVDVTARKQDREDLTNREQRLESIFKASPTGIGLVIDRVLTEVNDRFCEMTGFSREEMVGQDARMLYPTREEYERVGRVKYEQIRAKGTGTLETVMQRKDGELIDVLMSSTPLDQDDASLGVTFTALDITAQKKAEAEKERAEARYRQTQKVEAIGQLAGGVAHDLNNLLSPVIGFTELLLQDTATGDPRRDSLEQIMKAGIGARDLVRQLLAFSRKQALEYVPLDLNESLTGFEKLLRRTIRENIQVDLVKSPDLRSVMADVGQVEQVIMNLAINAADAMPDGGRLIIETENIDLDEDYVRQNPGSATGPHVMLAFCDTGHGMDAATCERIFEPFFSTKGQQGTGLGLSTVYGIVKQHKGSIWVYSEPGRGTTFKVYLPVSAEPPAGRRKKAAADFGAQGTGTILLVEDNDQVRLVTEAILERMGYTVLAAANGREALDVLQDEGHRVDLLLTDVIMPDLNGRELHGRAAVDFPDLKVLYMSGYTGDVIVHHGVVDEGVCFLQKPFTAETLALKVKEAMGG